MTDNVIPISAGHPTGWTRLRCQWQWTANMTDNVIPFPRPIELQGNGAREAMLAHILETGCMQADGEAWVDFTLADLWVRGFKVVPVDG